ncbi:MAG TPA: alpha-N-arabinofuranosidase [Candidatus Marinimicrobia bacterium]|nr:alpha-N-arabinofuranosidase [Candidatus Neomarinimicrobiota bacterium]
MRFPKVFALFIGLSLVVLNAGDSPNSIRIHADQGTETISRHIYGHFAEHLGNCIYGGFWVGENSPIPNTRGIRNDVIAALKEIDPPVIRWPGGCFADTYHWQDGIGPRDQRPAIINSTWGGVTEDNSFGTHEFLDLCEILGAEPYICINVGSGTVQEAADWVEYVNSGNQSPMTDLRKANGREQPWHVKFWAVGNESWGCGGNMTPEYYTDLFKRYSTYLRAGELYRIASGGTDQDYHWTETVLQKTENYRHLIQGYSFHYYTVCHGWDKKGSATQFDENDWFHTMKNTLVMEERLQRHIELMDKSDPENRIGLMVDEWGNWFDVEPGTNPGFLYQQNTLRDAVTAALYLNIFNNHARRVKMANIAQTINVLQAMLLTRDDQLVKTPTFYVFKMYKVHQDATLLPLEINCEPYRYNDLTIPAVSASASKDASGNIHVSLCNIDPNRNVGVAVELRGVGKLTKSSGSIITADAMNAYNDFGQPEQVNIRKFLDYKLKKELLTIFLPAKSVVTVTLE